MAQHDFSIANQTFPATRADLNNALQALATLSSGATAPTTTYSDMLWYDTANNILKMRSEADDAWLSIGYLDQSANAFRILDDTQVVNTSGTQTGLLGDQATSAWEAGTSTTESLVSPAKVKAAVDSLGLGGGVGGSDIQRDYDKNLPVVTVAAGDVSSAQGEGFAEGQTSTNSTSFVVAARYTIKSYTGSLRFVGSHRASSGSPAPGSTLNLYKNGVLVQSYTTLSTSNVSRTNDVSIVPGDVIEWRHKISFGGSTSTASGVRAGATDPYVVQPAFRLSSEELSI